MSVELDGNAIAIGRGALQALRDTLLRDLGDEAPQRLQEAGQAGGADLYACFERWLWANAGVEDPGEIDARALGKVLSDFFQALGWGPVAIETLGHGVLALDSERWAEADPEAGTPYPACFLSAGVLTEFMGRLANRPVSVMEVECRSASHPRCRFLVSAPETLETIYQAISEGKDYRSVLSSAVP
jgi:predicted hydrocarbon binding protein